MTSPIGVEIVKRLEPGVGYSSIPFSTTSLPAAGVDIFKGQGFGFIVLPVGAYGAHSSVVKVEIVGVGKQSNDVMWVTPNVWYECAFAGLRAIVNDKLSSGELDQGSWVANIGIKPYAHVYPSFSNSGFASIPAASGGSPLLTDKTVTLPLAGAVPVAATDGVAIGAAAQLESMYQVLVDIRASSATIEGGGVDIWRYIGALSLWFLVVQNLALPTGATNVATPVGYLGPRKIGDYFYATPSAGNPIITSDGVATAVDVTLRIQ